MKTKKQLRLLGAVALAILMTLFVAACGGDDDSDNGSSDAASAEHTDGAFIAEMVPHHETAIEMAEIARTRAEHPETKQLASEIIATQSEEIAQLEQAHRRLFDAELGGVVHGTLGLSEEESGMAHDAAALENASPFDQEFIDMMIPHHQGAIRMARIEVERGQDPELKDLATAIIDAQSAEIEEMNTWREQWYGGPSPAGGIPEEGEEAPSHEEMGH
jgi:uncharacterized protein (DUF305 family)